MGRVGGAVDTAVVSVQLVEVKVGDLESVLALGESELLVDTVLGAQSEEYREERLVLFRLDVGSTQEAVLLDRNRG